MELIKIERPIKENMLNTLTEEEADKLFEEVKYSVSLEESSEVLNEGILAGIGIGITVIYILSNIITYIKNKYRLTVNQVFEQSKELNDIYSKVEDLLKHDKMARYIHGNDRMECVIDSIVMTDKTNSKKTYQLKMDYLTYDPEYFMKRIDSIISKVQSNKNSDLAKLEAELMKDIDDNLNSDHYFITKYVPVMKTSLYKNTSLEKCVMEYKTWVTDIYEIMYYYNQYITDEVLTIQFLQHAYNGIALKYKDNKEYMDMVDRVFKKLAEQETMSIEFNQKAMDILTVMIKNYSDRLTVIYNKLKER